MKITGQKARSIPSYLSDGVCTSPIITINRETQTSESDSYNEFVIISGKTPVHIKSNEPKPPHLSINCILF